MNKFFKYIILGLLLLKSLAITAQADKANVRLTWLNPVADTFGLEESQLSIEVLIAADVKLDGKSVFILLNEKKVGAKGDIVSISQLNNKGTVFTFKGALGLNEGENRIKVGITLPNQSTYFTIPKVLKKEGQQITELIKSHADGEQGIFWQQPHWQSAALVVEKRQLPIKVIINSPVEINKSAIYFVRDKIAKISLPENASLEELSAGKYELTGSLPLTEEGIASFTVKIKSPLTKNIESVPLAINFSPHRPNLHVLAIGTQTNLTYSTNDAKDLAELFQTQSQQDGGPLYNTVDIKTLTGVEATSTAIKTAIERLESKYKTGQLGKKDLILLFLSSHGFLDYKRQLRLQGDDYDPGAWRTTSVSYERDIIEVLASIPCRKVILIDACHSGGEGAKGADFDIKYSVQTLHQNLQGVTSIVSSRGSQVSYEDDLWKNGAFTEALIEGLKYNQADADRNHYITLDELWQFINKRVPFLVEKTKSRIQQPQLLVNELGTTPIFFVK